MIAIAAGQPGLILVVEQPLSDIVPTYMYPCYG